MVRVVLHGRRVGGWVLRVGAPPADVPVERLVPLAKWSGVGPSAELIDLAEWASRAVGRGAAATVPRHREPADDGPRARRAPRARRHARADASRECAQLLRDGGGVSAGDADDDPAADRRRCRRDGPALVVHPSVDARARSRALRARAASRSR
jgi:primosomal protein N' (replication factor Y)